MRLVIDIEANGLADPTKVWVIACKDIDTGVTHVFRKVSDDDNERNKFLELASKVTLWVGHNWLEYDYPVLHRLIGLCVDDVWSVSIDTLVLSRLVNYSRDGHSIEDYGLEFGLPKIEFNDFSKYTPEMEVYCTRDTEICYRIFRKFSFILNDASWASSISLEHWFQFSVINSLHCNGFGFNVGRASSLLERVSEELQGLDDKILGAFPARLKLVREIHPKETKYGTINKTDFRWVKDGDLTVFNGGPFSRCSWESFNPSSHKQIINVLSEAGWRPTVKTKTHTECERELHKLKYQREHTSLLDIERIRVKLKELEKSGWKINEQNLDTLPSSAPTSARLLARRILIEARRRTLTEWLELVQGDGRIHGKFYGIGAWTHRMAHQNPNTANIPNDYDTQGKKKPYGKEMRSCWCAPRKRLLVGVDAEGIQLRIFAHLIDDLEFTQALVNGDKSKGTDPHSLNQRIMGSVCKSREGAKRFIYALLLGAGLGKLSEILDCSQEEAEEALNRVLERYTGFDYLKREVIPRDAKRGYFIGLDGRRISIPGDTVGTRKHLCMSGYLQSGEVIVMKRATKLWWPVLKETEGLLVDLVHDEWQTECPNNMEIALRIAKAQADALRQVGEDLNLKCPLAGSYWNDKAKDYTIGTNWSVTH